ncbi:hypothetical protein MTR_8g098920 [Medicago truncatula]|uniref:Uncharacterized protein n=1 Tax=Medicago truncatula TaxID=3880 RepID=A0A072U5K1_MEDTR|nr:hypothetical protein MTR_8g098920 [Medicago truncatula]
MGIASGRVSDFNGLVFDIRDRPFILTQNSDCSPDNPPTRSNLTVYPFFNSVFRVTVGKAKTVRKWNQSIITIVIQIQILETTSDPFFLSAKIVKTVYGGVYTTDASTIYNVAAFSLLLLSQTVLNAATRCLCCGCKEGQSMNGKGMRRK